MKKIPFFVLILLSIHMMFVGFVGINIYPMKISIVFYLINIIVAVGLGLIVAAIKSKRSIESSSYDKLPQPERGQKEGACAAMFSTGILFFTVGIIGLIVFDIKFVF